MLIYIGPRDKTADRLRLNVRSPSLRQVTLETWNCLPWNWNQGRDHLICKWKENDWLGSVEFSPIPACLWRRQGNGVIALYPLVIGYSLKRSSTHYSLPTGAHTFWQLKLKWSGLAAETIMAWWRDWSSRLNELKRDRLERIAANENTVSFHVYAIINSTEIYLFSLNSLYELVAHKTIRVI